MTPIVYQAKDVATREPEHTLIECLKGEHTAIEAWFAQRFIDTTPPFTASVDLRNAGFKVAPIDTNIFPAGFNNLHPNFSAQAVLAVQHTMAQRFPDAKRILLIPENHTRNLFYLENIASLQTILQTAGFEARLGSLLEDFKTGQNISLPSGRVIHLETVNRICQRLNLSEFEPDLIVLNNDMSGSIPELLQDLKQAVVPKLQLAWATRLKSSHFFQYQQVANDFAAQFNFDPWLISTLFRNCGTVDFSNKTGQTCLVHNAEKLFLQLQDHYSRYNIQRKPFIVVKADSGSYGMAVMTIYDPAELAQLNRKHRTRMQTTKNGQPVTKIILQEGVPSIEHTRDAPQATAEPVIYMIGGQVIGGFYRVHPSRGSDQNLNSPGMSFHRMSYADVPSAQTQTIDVYGILARLAALAAGREANLQRLV